MNNLTEQQIRQIVKDEMNRNYLSGNPQIPPHSHNGTDNLHVSPLELEGWSAIPTTPQTYTNEFTGLQEFGFGSPQQLVGGSSTNASQTIWNATIAQYPVPIVSGNGRISGQPQGDFAGGYAPDGTIVLFDNGVRLELHARWAGQWRGVELPIVT
jgi:hypothetical protein